MSLPAGRVRWPGPAVLAVPLFALTTWQVGAGGAARTADERLGGAMRRSAPPEPVAELLADLGNMEVALPVLGAAALWVGVRGHRWRAVCCCLLAMAAVPPVVSLLKAWTDRPGPLGGGGYYPSGHAATLAVAWGGAALLARRAPGAASRWWGGPLPPVVAVVAVVLSGAGLVWRGYHWPLDVFGAWCLALPLLAAAAAFSGPPLRRSGRPPRAGPVPGPPGR
ncbi:phosphatase PAP2 family protein [Streptomyces sp. AJS327]|uniref:phosphatase PAP2 family protein n=1 Tax=Streptomyces sp. AJS327 TaxID=2545265 RepID=UPI0015DEA0ED|nr:phosphatase PAP2 family protein [Streptomyces sp. AJS327]